MPHAPLVPVVAATHSRVARHQRALTARRRSVAVLALGLGVGLAACRDAPTAPTAQAGALVRRSTNTATATSSLPTQIANTIKYNDAGVHPATGRSGSANLTTRALLSKDQSVLLEITTGALDVSATPPGNLSKVQYKILDPNGVNTGVARNYNGLIAGGYASYTIQTAPHGFQLRTQANIEGIDGPRTDVATVTTPVVYRPDLAVTAFAPPAQVPVNQTVSFGATVQELNGDVGAHANCVLYADGTEIDRANSIWVDAKGMVSCAFSAKFTTTGQKTLTVAVEQVVPGDWDLTNNSATAQITVVGGNDFRNHGQAYDRAFVDNSRTTWSWTDGHIVLQGDSGATRSGRDQIENFGGEAPQEVTFPVQSLVASLSSGGTQLYSVSVTDLSAPDPSMSGNVYKPTGTVDSHGQLVYVPAGYYNCAARAKDSGYGYVWIQFCSGQIEYKATPTNPTGAFTGTSMYRYAGDVVYQSWSYGTEWYGGATSCTTASFCYSRNYSGSITSPEPLLSYGGSDATLQIVASDGTTTLTNALQIPLTAFSFTYDPWSQYVPASASSPYCVSSSDGAYNQYQSQQCFTWQTSYTGVSGWGLGAPGSSAPTSSGPFWTNNSTSP